MYTVHSHKETQNTLILYKIKAKVENLGRGFSDIVSHELKFSQKFPHRDETNYIYHKD